MKRTFLILLAATVLTSCENCYDFTIRHQDEQVSPSGVFQTQTTKIESETRCGITKREANQYAKSISGYSEFKQNGYVVKRNTVVSYSVE